MPAFRKKTEEEMEERSPTKEEEVVFDGTTCPFCKQPLLANNERVSFLVPSSTVEYLSMLIGCSCGAKYQIKYSNPELISATLPEVEQEGGN